MVPHAQQHFSKVKKVTVVFVPKLLELWCVYYPGIYTKVTLSCLRDTKNIILFAQNYHGMLQQQLPHPHTRRQRTMVRKLSGLRRVSYRAISIKVIVGMFRHPLLQSNQDRGT